MRQLVVLAAAVLLCACIGQTHASEGDYDPHFLSCLGPCMRDCDANLRPALSIGLRLMQWSCPENCQYECMIKNRERRKELGLPVAKYYGKWPFDRVLGAQEIASTVFSIANFMPHLYFFGVYRRTAPSSYPLRNWWSGYGIVAMCTWVFSTAFHARDTKLTERLDYFFANAMVLYASFAVMLRTFRLYRVRFQLILGLPLLVLYTVHICYMTFVTFDYNYNMAVTMLVGSWYSLLWISWGTYQATVGKRTYCWKIVISTTCLVLFAMLEIGDFAPFFGVFDAHAIWHGSTPVLSVALWSFLCDDAVYESKRRPTNAHDQ